MFCAEIVKDKPTGNYSGFIRYSNTINFSGIWLDKIFYLVTQWFFLKEQAFSWCQKNWKNQKIDQSWGNKW